MAHYGTLRDFRFSETDVDDVRGSSVYGTDDDKLGKIDDVIFDHSTGDIRYAVIDTEMTRSELAGAGLKQAKEGHTLGPITLNLFCN